MREFYFFLSIVSASSSSSSLCPSGWTDGSSAGLGCLHFNAETGMDWNAASSYCKATEGASLVEILTPEQMDFLMAELASLEISVAFSFNISRINYKVDDRDRLVGHAGGPEE